MARSLRLPILVLLGACLASSCMREEDAGAFAASAAWGSLEVAVEVRAQSASAHEGIANGRNEVVVVITAERQRPVFDAVVELRARPEAAWVQAIEDGHVGVYRRAVDFGPDAARATLEVRLRREQEPATILRFPPVSLRRR